jgi:hypothetical protein
VIEGSQTRTPPTPNPTPTRAHAQRKSPTLRLRKTAATTRRPPRHTPSGGHHPPKAPEPQPRETRGTPRPRGSNPANPNPPHQKRPPRPGPRNLASEDHARPGGPWRAPRARVEVRSWVGQGIVTPLAGCSSLPDLRLRGLVPQSSPSREVRTCAAQAHHDTRP